ncbi:MAG: hypothetical protein Q7J03_05355 [Methanoregula sp.]|nr:hypothetical protein [Methanoregula sp.]
MKYSDIPDFSTENLEVEYQKSVKTCQEFQENIEKKLRNFDKIELFSRYLLMTRSHLSGERVLGDIIEDYPVFHFCLGLALKQDEGKNTEPSLTDSDDLVWLLQSYFEEYMKSSYLSMKLSNNVDEGLISLSRQHYLINQINKERYPFQTKELLQQTFGYLDDFFTGHIGFNINDAIIFIEKIVQHFEKKIQERIQLCCKIRKNNKKFDNKIANQLFQNSKEFIEIDIVPFCKINDIKDIEKFRKYLDCLSCCFGDGNPTFSLPTHDNLIHKKPIIKYQFKYYCIDPDLLFNNLPEIFEGFLDDEKKVQSSVWERYKEKKSQFTERKVKEFLLRVFSKSDVYDNLYFPFEGKRLETDHIITYCRNFLIIEDKSGLYSIPAKRGGIFSIKTDLEKLIVDSYQQGLNCRDYIRSTKNASFERKNGEPVLDIKFEPYKTHFLIVNVTLEHLYSFSTSLKILDSLKIFQNDEYPWSVSLFELDLITRSITSPVIFIHYIESRIESQKDNYSFFAFDEISFLSYYLQNGNFIIYPKNGKMPELTLTPDYIKPFDRHYTHGDPAPKLMIEDEILKIITDLEKIRPDHLTRITNAILNLPHHLRKWFIFEIGNACYETSTDGISSHSSMYNNLLNTGFTVFTQIGRDNLQEKIADYCWLKKYQCKANCWIGFGIDILDKKYFAQEVVCFESDWKYDKELENSLISAIKCGIIEKLDSGEKIKE